ncbi:MAG: hypothetical protein J6O18_06190 [Bacilli bacterium]|nr:hypothetical protein [Bacilli bacterium]
MASGGAKENRAYKPGKTQILLHCLETLLREGKIAKSQILSFAPISEPTFTRYIQEIRAYLYNFHPGYELEYCKWDDVYILNKDMDSSKQK